MIKKALIFVVISIVVMNYSIAQNTFGNNAASGLDANTAIGGFISQIDRTNYDPIGDVYVNNSWESSSIMLRNEKLIKGLDIRINLLKNSIDIRDKKSIRTFTIQKIKYIDMNVLSDSAVRYFNPFEFKFYDFTPVTGLVRQVTDNGSKWDLVERTYLKIYEATYVKALDAGTKTDRYEVETENYLEKDNILYPIVASKKKLANSLELDDSGKNDLVDFIKKEKINLKEVASARKILHFLNE